MNYISHIQSRSADWRTDHADDWPDGNYIQWGKSGLKPVISRCLYPGLKSGVIQDIKARVAHTYTLSIQKMCA